MKTTVHKSCIETELICSVDGKNTYEIIKRINGADGDIGILVMLFPTRNGDNIDGEDSTLNHLVTHMKDFNFKEIRIINLFSKVVSTRISERGLEVDSENLKFINDVVLADKEIDKQKFIVAWGNSMETSKAVNDSKRQIIEMYLKALPKGKIYQIVCPERNIISGAAHPLFLGIRAKTSKWRLMEYDTKEILKDNTINKMSTISTTSTAKSK